MKEVVCKSRLKLTKTFSIKREQSESLFRERDPETCNATATLPTSKNGGLRHRGF